jgi:hypothetical protein
MSIRALRLLAALLVAVLALAACGGDDDEPAATSTTTEAEEEEPEESTTTTEAEDTEEDTTETTEAAAGGTLDEGSLESIDFCELDRVGDESDAFLILFDPASTPEQINEASSFIAAFYARINDAAPPEIAGDVATVVSGAEAYLSTLAEYDFDNAALAEAMEADPELEATMAGFEDPAFQAAADNVDAWVEVNCPAA